METEKQDNNIFCLAKDGSVEKEYILKFVDPQVTITEESKEDFKKLMNWSEEEFMSHVFVRLRGRNMLIQGQINLEKEKQELAHKIINLTKQFQEYKDMIINELDADKIYPNDISPEIDIENIKHILNEHLLTAFNFSLDRLSAHILRLALNKLKSKII